MYIFGYKICDGVDCLTGICCGSIYHKKQFELQNKTRTLTEMMSPSRNARESVNPI